MFSVATLRPKLQPRETSARHRMDHHPLVSAAASGQLPEWAVAGPARREHMGRVAALLDTWATASHLVSSERARWRAAGYLHDALRDAHPTELRGLVHDTEELPNAVLHGPAAAERLRREGVLDEELLAAVAYHTLGDPSLGELGRALYAADFLEPGRPFLAESRAEMRARAPHDMDSVVEEVAKERIRQEVGRGRPLHPRTVAFWNQLVEGHSGE